MVSVYDPIKIGPIEAPNRFHYTPMVTLFVDPDGYVNDQYLKNFARIAKGGYGLVTVMATFVHPTGRGFRRQLAIWDDKFTPGHIELVEAAREAGMDGIKVGIQLFHGGAIANPIALRKDETPLAPHAVSPVSMPSFFDPSIMTHALTDEEVEEIIESFGAAAARAKEAGYDYILIHANHQSLIQQFMSPRWNTREDQWGKDKLLFARKCTEAIIKAARPELAIIPRISVSEHPLPGEVPPGYVEEDTYKTFLPFWEHMKADGIEVSTGGLGSIHAFTWMSLPLYYDQGLLVMKFAKEVKKRTKLPIGGVGKIMDPKMAERFVAEGTLDWASFGRSPWADPDYPRKGMEGRYEDVRRCTSCDYCWWRLIVQRPCRCAVNWVFGREYLGLEKIEPTDEPKNILVIGGGPTGMEFARVAHLRGHNATIYEQKDKLGGLVLIASDIPYLYTMDLRHMIIWLETQIKKLGIKAELNKRVTTDTVKKLKPDAVVLATGSIPHLPDISGIGGPNVMTVDDYLWEKPEVSEIGEKVVILGGDEGAETAISLARQGVKVSLISETASVMESPYLYSVMRTNVIDRYLKESGVEIITKAKINEIKTTRVGLTDEKGERKFIECNKVIAAFGRKPAGEELYKALIDLGYRPHVNLFRIGDCLKPRHTYHAIDDANILARKL